MLPEQQITKLKGMLSRSPTNSGGLFNASCSQRLHNKALIKRFSTIPRALGFRILRRGIGRYCINDRGPRNPTAGNLIEAITRPEADQLRRELKSNKVRSAYPISRRR